MILGYAVIKENTIDLAVHEDVYQLVADHMPKIPHRAVVRDDDSTFEELKEPSDTFRDKAGSGVGLLEVEMRAVKNERDAVADVVVELLFKDLVALFRKERSALGEVFHFGIVIDVEVVSFQNMPVEIGVLDFIASEIEKLRRCGGDKKKTQWDISDKPTAHTCQALSQCNVSGCKIQVKIQK